MSGVRSDPAPGDRYRPGDLEWAAKDKDSLESWNWPKGSTMTTPSRTVAASSPDASRKNENISVSQRMVSATCGSILTNLLGKGIASCDLAQICSHWHPVTPLDVVRVRLQSQSSIKNTSPFTSHTTQTLKNVPPNLGVTSCCREVFWIGQNSQICMVGPNEGSVRVSSAAMADCAVEESRRKTFTSTLDGIRKIARNEGARTLWRGLTPTMMMSIPANIIYFAGYDWLRSDEKSPINRLCPDAYAPFVAGATARIGAAAAISPIEMFRTRLQATPGTGAGHFKTTLEGLHRMTQIHGYGSLWRGLTLTMWRDVPFSGLYWWGYEEAKKYLLEARKAAHEHGLPHLHITAHSSQDDETPTFFESFLGGATSGALAALVTTPFDVGKTRQQVFRHLGNEVPSTLGTAAQGRPVPPELLSLPKFLLHIFREEGMPGLFRGWVARCLKVAPACAIMISTYEFGKKMAQDVNERHISTDAESIS